MELIDDQTSTSRRIQVAPRRWWQRGRHQTRRLKRQGRAVSVAALQAAETWSPFNCLGEIRTSLFTREGFAQLGALREPEDIELPPAPKVAAIREWPKNLPYFGSQG